MNQKKIETCERLCREFLKRKKALDEKVGYLRKQPWIDDDFRSFEYLSKGTRESGDLRRTSMELTRALADLRRPVEPEE